MDLVGREFYQRYKVVDKIGGGGMSVVWKAYDMVLDRFVAFKVLRPEMSQDDDFIARFRREAQSAASLSHHNIVNIFDVGEEAGIHFIVMELIEGQTLRQKLQSQGPLNVNSALDIAAQICEGLSHAHARRIIHRDIKPQNILITKNGLVKVADFGIARALGQASYTSRDVVVGSAPYLSPEQAKNAEVSAASDLYSLGVVLYEMLEGKPPYEGDSPIAVAYQHVEGQIPSLRRKGVDVPDGVEDLVRKSLSKDPKMRFSSAEDMRRAILAQKTSTEPEGAERLQRGQRKKRRLSLGTKALLGFLVVVLGISLYAYHLFSQWMNVPTVEVPDVVGMTQTQAQATIKEKGLIPQISAERYDENIPMGEIISQSPLGGESAKEGREIYYVVSKGQEYAKVPYLLGMSKVEAELEIGNAGLLLGRLEPLYHPEIPEGKVISQNPKGGLDVTKGLAVDLQVSLGPEPEITQVPHLVGLPLERAQQLLRESLLAIDTVTQVEDQSPKGTVVAQQPEADTVAPVLSKVSLLVSEGPKGPGSQVYSLYISVPRNIAPPGSLVNVRAVLEDAVGTRTVFDMNMSPGSSKTVAVEWQGSSAIINLFVGDQKSVIDLTS